MRAHENSLGRRSPGTCRALQVSAAEFADVHLHAPLEAVLAAYRSPEAARLAVPDDVDSEAQRAALFTEDDAYFHP